jgi:DNA-binding transcriptional LysR family regulator
MNLNTLDLNLMRVFNAVMTERSITAAGGRLGLTQSATSSAIKRLRSQFNDPLFVRTADGMSPTGLATDLAEPVAAALKMLKDAIEVERNFVPSESQRTFRLLMTDTGDLMFLPKLMAHLRKTAPRVKVSCCQIPRDKYGEALEAGTAEIALGMLPTGMRDFSQQRLRDETLVCLVSQTNKSIGATLTVKQFLAADHVSIMLPCMSDRLVVRGLGSLAAQRSVVLEVQHYLAVPMILQNSDLLAVVPKTVATALAQLNNLRVMPLPFEVTQLPIKQYWHRRSNSDPGHKWLRGEIVKLFGN